jgi:indoleamine 2,3-dioxygenase
MEYSNLRLIRAFENGLDPSSSEAGFVLVHVEMVKHSGPLVAGTMACLRACSPADEHVSSPSPERREHFNSGLRGILDALKKINKAMDAMWIRSKPSSYTSFRTFIFGITSQSMFPHGVVYEGVNDNEPMSFRGESGANDSMIPLVDNLLQIPMPDTPLTEILRDFRDYRPSNHRAFLEFVRERSHALALKEYVWEEDGVLSTLAERDAARESQRLWLLILDRVREFRWRHWRFAREYILKRTGHPTATGGSPIVTWLPNQLAAVLEEMEHLYGLMKRDVGEGVGEGEVDEDCGDIMELVSRQKTMLRKEVSKYCADRGVPLSL